MCISPKICCKNSDSFGMLKGTCMYSEGQPWQVSLNPAPLCGACQGIDNNPALPCNPGWDDLANHQNEVCRAARFKDRKSGNLTTHARWESCRPGSRSHVRSLSIPMSCHVMHLKKQESGRKQATQEGQKEALPFPHPRPAFRF